MYPRYRSCSSFSTLVGQLNPADLLAWLVRRPKSLVVAALADDLSLGDELRVRANHRHERIRLPADLFDRGQGVRLFDVTGRSYLDFIFKAAKLAFVLALLGHDDVSVYDGGWADWGDRLDLPVDR